MMLKELSPVRLPIPPPKHLKKDTKLSRSFQMAKTK